MRVIPKTIIEDIRNKINVIGSTCDNGFEDIINVTINDFNNSEYLKIDETMKKFYRRNAK